MMSLGTFSTLAGAIHEAALAPGGWDDVLGCLAAAFDAGAAGIIAGPTPQQPGLTVAAGIDPAAVRSYEAYYCALDPIVPAIQKMPAGTVLTHDMVVPMSVLARSEFYNDWIRPQGINDCLIAKFMPENDAGVVCLTTPPGRNDFTPEVLEVMQALTPHLRIAVRTGRLLQGRSIERDGALDALGRLGQAAFFVDAAGLVVHANGAGEALLQRADGLSCGKGGLQAATSSLTSELRGLIARAAGRGSPVRLGGSLRLERPSGRASLVVTISPLSRNSADLLPLHFAEAMVLVASPEQVLPPTAHTLRDLFGLTPAEAGVAVAVAQGRGVKGAAAALGVAPSTVRTHLHRAFGKTGTQRQAELAHLVDQVASPGVQAME